MVSDPTATLRARSGAEWLGYLKAQRWFAAKGEQAVEATLEGAVAVVGDEAAPFAVGRLLVRFASGAEQRYQVFEGDFAAGIARALRRASGGGTPFEAAGDDGLRWIVEASVGLAEVPQAASGVRQGSAEQSNTSLIIGDAVIAKLFRKLESGVQPDVEVTRFLTSEAHFPNTPPLVATMRFEQHGVTTVAGMAQQYLPGSSDAWSYLLELGKANFATGAPDAVIRTARELGVVTRELHEALGSGNEDEGAADFTAEHVEEDDVEAWAEGVRRSIDTALDLLERQLASGGAGALQSVRLGQAQALLGRRDRYLEWVGETLDALEDDLGARIRIHGDYHLGQVLRTTDGRLMVIDFEGEPARPLAERRAKSSPMRDVAGMMRSFSYAAATLLAGSGGGADAARTAGERETKAARLERDLRSGFLAGYRSVHDPEAAELLPESWDNAMRLMALFEAEKAFYELAYELNHRPGWVWIPMRGVSKLLV